MWTKIEKIFDRFGLGVDAYQLARGVGVIGGGAVTGVLSSTVEWVDQFGWFGWWVAFLFGCVLTAATMSLAALVRLRLVEARMYLDFEKRGSSVNPLETEFHKKRIKLSDLMPPTFRPISKKKFIDCELVGPCVILFTDGMNINGLKFESCDLMPTKRQLSVRNGLIMQDCHIIGGSIIGATILLHPDVLAALEAQPGMINQYYPTLTGNPQIDDREPINR